MLSNQKSTNDFSSSIRNSPIEVSDSKSDEFKSKPEQKFDQKHEQKLEPKLNQKLEPKLDLTQSISLKDLRSKIEEYVKSQHRDPNYDWVRFYRFKHITGAALITRAKIYQTAFVLGIFGWSMMKYLDKAIAWEQALVINCVTGFSLVFLVIMGNVSRRVIGICYADPKHPDLVRIAHLSFFGKRIDRVVKLNDISVLSDTNVKKESLFFKLVIRVDGKNQTFFLANNKMAEIDKSVYKKIFGSLQ